MQLLNIIIVFFCRALKYHGKAIAINQSCRYSCGTGLGFVQKRKFTDEDFNDYPLVFLVDSSSVLPLMDE